MKPFHPNSSPSLKGHRLSTRWSNWLAMIILLAAVFGVSDAARISSGARVGSRDRVLGVGEPADEFPVVEDGPKPDRMLPPRAAAWLRLYANATIPYHAMAEYNIQKLHGANIGAEYPSIKQPHGDIYHYDHQNEIKVIVVGGGMAGLSAARTLLDLGLKDVLVLEGNAERVGGRTSTFATPDGDLLEEGAEWVHDWNHYNSISRLSYEQGWPSVSVSVAFTQLALENGTIDRCGHLGETLDVYQRMEFARRARRFPIRRSDLRFLEKHRGEGGQEVADDLELQRKQRSDPNWESTMFAERGWIDPDPEDGQGQCSLDFYQYKAFADGFEEEWGSLGATTSSLYHDHPNGNDRMLPARYRQILEYLLDGDVKVELGARVTDIQYPERQRFHEHVHHLDRQRWERAADQTSEAAAADRRDELHDLLAPLRQAPASPAAASAAAGASAQDLVTRPRARVHTANGEVYEADYVIVAAALGVLKDKKPADRPRIRFDPPLPDTQRDAIERMAYGGQNKVYLQFPHAFWEKSDDWEPTNARFKSREAPGESDDEETQEEYERRREQYFRWIERSHVPGTEFSYWDPCYNYPYQKPVSWYRWHAEGAEGAYQFIINEHLALTKQPILLGMTGEPYATIQDTLPIEQIRDDLMRVLRQIFGEDIPDPVAVWTSRWGADPLSQGALSFVAPGGCLCDSGAMATPVDDVIVLAGEHTASVDIGTVFGAINSGERAAKQVMEDVVAHTRAFAETPTSLRQGHSFAAPLAEKPKSSDAATWARYAREAHSALQQAIGTTVTSAAAATTNLLPATALGVSVTQPLPREALATHSLNHHEAQSLHKLPPLPQPTFTRFYSYGFTSQATVAVIGSGIAGLAAARRLVDGGIPASNIVILEPSNHLGGLSGFTHYVDHDEDDFTDEDHEVDDVLLLRSVDFANPLTSRLSLYFETNAMPLSPWHSFVVKVSSGVALTCEHLQTLAREVQLAEFARRARRTASEFEVEDNEDSLQKRLAQCSLLSPESRRLIASLLLPTATHAQSNTWTDLQPAGQDVALVDGVRLLLRELVEGPVFVTSNQLHLSRRVWQPEWATEDYRERIREQLNLLETRSEAQSQENSVASTRHEIKQKLAEAKTEKFTRRVQAPMQAAKEADQVVEDEHVRPLQASSSSRKEPLNELPDLGRRVEANKLDVRRGLGRLRVEWSDRRKLHHEMMEQDAAVWSNVYSSLSDADWANKGDKVLLDMDPKLTQPEFGGVDGPIKLISYRKSALNERPQVNIQAANGQRFAADYVVMASPLHWMDDHIELSPSLPEAMTNAMRHVGTAFSVRIHLIFDKPFWTTDPAHPFASSQDFRFTEACPTVTNPLADVKGDQSYFVALGDDDASTVAFLNGFRISGRPHLLVDLPVDADVIGRDGRLSWDRKKVISQRLMRALHTIWPIAPQPRRVTFARPSAHYYTKPSMRREHFEALQQPLEDAIVLADSFQRVQDIGTLHGAYSAGCQAAERILKDVENRALEHEIYA